MVNSQSIEQKQLGRYVLFRPLFGRSKGSQTFLARETNVDRVVEFHMLDETLSAQVETQKRFLHECKIIASLDHPNVLKILDFGLVDGHLYYTVPSRNSMRMRKLRENLGGRMDEETTLDVAHALSEAVAHLHEHEVLHRDIDLDTVFMDLDEDRPFLADFSLAKHAGKGGLTAVGIKRTRQMQIIPEIVFQKPVDGRTDVYLLGLVLYSLLTGEDPNTLEAVKARSTGDVPSFELKHLDAFGLGMDPAFSQAVMKMVAADPEERFQSAADMAKAVKKLYDKARVHDMIEQMKSDVMSSQTELITKSLVEKAEQAKQDRERRKEERKRQVSRSIPAVVAKPALPGWGFWPVAALLGALALCLVASLLWNDAPPQMPTATRPPAPTRPRIEVSEAEYKKVRDEVIMLSIRAKDRSTSEENFKERRVLLKKLVDFAAARNRKLPFQPAQIAVIDGLAEKDPVEACLKVDALLKELREKLPAKVLESYVRKMKAAGS